MVWVFGKFRSAPCLRAGFSKLRLPGMVCVLSVIAATAAFAQESSGGEHGPYDTLGPWKITNTLIFIVVLGYFLYKKAPAFFNARSADIQKAIRDATGLKMEADLRYSEMDRKMATLNEEVNRLRQESEAEMQHEKQRRDKELEGSINRIQTNADAQIEAFRQAGVRSLENYAAQAALELAARRMEEQVTGNLSGDSMQEFIHLVERGRN